MGLAAPRVRVKLGPGPRTPAPGAASAVPDRIPPSARIGSGASDRRDPETPALATRLAGRSYDEEGRFRRTRRPRPSSLT
jgi:hypothetical protein